MPQPLRTHGVYAERTRAEYCSASTGKPARQPLMQP